MIDFLKRIINFLFVIVLKLFTSVKLSFAAKISPDLFKFLLKNRPERINLRNVLTGRGTIQISEGVTFFHKAELFGNVKIDRYTSISGPATRICSKVYEVNVGAFCSIASGVVIQEFYHNTKLATTYNILNNVFHSDPNNRTAISKGPIVIEEDVWIGSNAVILSGVKIGRGAIIGAGSIVTKDVERYAVVGGNPAKKIKYRFLPETIKMLEESRWWEWPLSKIKKEFQFFNTERD